jgi:hypothetical protein
MARANVFSGAEDFYRLVSQRGIKVLDVAPYVKGEV